jgi:riboflavin kinase/FMN adenylyltransferase
MPANGVYAVMAVIDSQPRLGMANIGLRPTFTSDTKPTLEVHFLDVDVDLYQRTLDVTFIAKIRDERRFDSGEEFLAQLQLDRMQTTTYQHHIKEWRTS